MQYSPRQIAKIANINVETLRYYEKNGILPSPVRAKNGYRVYDSDTVERLETVKYAKSCGLTLKETKNIFRLVEMPTIDYTSIVELIDEKLIDIDDKIKHLNKMKDIFHKVKSNISAHEAQCPIKSTFENF